MSSTSIPMPPPQTHVTNHSGQPPTGATQNVLSVNNPFNGNRQRPMSQPQLSSSAPSFRSYLNGDQPPTTSRQSNDNLTNRSGSTGSSSGNRRDSTVGTASSNSPMLTIEFDGGTHVILRPNRIVRGKKRN
jgi:hypothetical protein